MDLEALLNAIRQRQANGHGIGLARNYLDAIHSCLGDEVCSAKFGSIASAEQWQEALKAAERKLVYHDDGMALVKTVTGAELTPGACMDFECILTSNRKDRDGDVMEPKGAIIDPRGPLLWQHIPLQPVGRHLRVVSNDGARIVERNSIIDSPLGRDAAQLVEFQALRISQGFNPLKFEPLKANKVQDQQPVGWHIFEYETMERSLVSIPSNVDAVITAFSREKLHHPLVKGWAEGLRRAVPKQVVSGWDGAALKPDITVNGQPANKTPEACKCDTAAACPDSKRPQIASGVHWIEKCSCGAVISQCRCTGAKKEVITPNGCPKCKSKAVAVLAKSARGWFCGLPYFENSYEWITGKLEDAARGHLQTSGISVGATDDLLVLGTFADAAVLGHMERNRRYDPYGYPTGPLPIDNDFDDDDGYHYYRCGWAMQDGQPTWSGTPEKVELVSDVRIAAKRMLMSAIKSGRSLSKKNHGLLKEAHELIGMVHDHADTKDTCKAPCLEAKGHLKDVIGEEEDGEPIKAGRVLSKTNLEKVEKAHKLAVETAEHTDMHRPGKSMLREAKGYIKEVLDSAKKAGDPNPEVDDEPGQPNPGVDDKDANAAAMRLTGLLTSGKSIHRGIAASLGEALAGATERAAEEELAAMLA